MTTSALSASSLPSSPPQTPIFCFLLFILRALLPQTDPHALSCFQIGLPSNVNRLLHIRLAKIQSLFVVPIIYNCHWTTMHVVFQAMPIHNVTKYYPLRRSFSISPIVAFLLRRFGLQLFFLSTGSPSYELSPPPFLVGDPSYRSILRKRLFISPRRTSSRFFFRS